MLEQKKMAQVPDSRGGPEEAYIELADEQEREYERVAPLFREAGKLHLLPVVRCIIGGVSLRDYARRAKLPYRRVKRWWRAAKWMLRQHFNGRL